MTNANSLFKALVLSLAFCWAKAQPPQVCEIASESCGQIPPPVENGYIMKGLVLNRKTKDFSWQEEYYDPSNYRAKSVDISRGTITTKIFDYNLETVTEYVQVHPWAPKDKDKERIQASTCIIENMVKLETEQNQFGGYYDRSKRSVMYGINKVLGYGGPYAFSYNSTDEIVDRGLKVNKFRGCIKDQDRQLDQTFFWTKDVSTNNGEPTVPARIESVGGFYTDDSNFKPTIWNDQDTQKDVAWFELTEPETQSFDIYQPPPRMNCKKSEGSSKKLPKIPNFFSARIESFITTENNIDGIVKDLTYDKYDELWYDYEEKLVRQDFIPKTEEEKKDIKLPGTSYLPLTAVYDFNTGVAYFTDRTNGICNPQPIPLWVKFADRLTTGNLEILKPAAFFQLYDHLLSYKGKYMMRDIETDAWIGEVKSTDPKMPGFREVYFLAEGFHLEADELQEYSVPIRFTKIMPTTHEAQIAYETTESNVYKFKEAKPAFSVYDIAGCVIHHPRRSFLVTFDNKHRETLLDNKAKVLQAAQVVIRDLTDVGSLLRVQELRLSYATSDNTPRLSFTLMDVPTEVADVTAPRRGVTLDQAVKNLKDKIQSDGLTIPFNIDEEKFISSNKDSLREIVYEGDKLIELQDSADTPAKDSASAYSRQLRSPTQAYTAPIKNEKSGYSPGAVGGLAAGMLLIGLLLGVLVMWHYSRRVNRSDTEIASARFENEGS